MDPTLVEDFVEVVVLLLLRAFLVAMVLPGAHGKADHAEGEVEGVFEAYFQKSCRHSGWVEVVGNSSGCIVEQTVAAYERFLDMKTNACFVAAEKTNHNLKLRSYEVPAAAEVQLLRKRQIVDTEPEAASAEKCRVIEKHPHATQNPIFPYSQIECLAMFLL